jgi:hypothetical protein
MLVDFFCAACLLLDRELGVLPANSLTGGSVRGSSVSIACNNILSLDEDMGARDNGFLKERREGDEKGDESSIVTPIIIVTVYCFAPQSQNCAGKTTTISCWSKGSQPVLMLD